MFPEGTTHDDPSIRPLRTGVARIALAASAAGVDGVQIVPVGLSYEDKIAVRGRALIEFGPPLDVPEGAASTPPAPRREDVDDLTARLTAAIRATTPDFASTEEAVALTSGASIALRAPGTTPAAVPLADSSALARRVAQPARTRVRVVDAVARYHLLLGTIGLVDGQVANGRSLTASPATRCCSPRCWCCSPPSRWPACSPTWSRPWPCWWRAWSPGRRCRRGPSGCWWPRWSSRRRGSRSRVWDVGAGPMSDTLRNLAFPLQPVLDGAYGTRQGFWPSLFVFVSIPVLGFLALLFVERSWALARDWRAWQARVDRRGQLGAVLDKRAVVAALTLAPRAGPMAERPPPRAPPSGRVGLRALPPRPVTQPVNTASSLAYVAAGAAALAGARRRPARPPGTRAVGWSLVAVGGRQRRLPRAGWRGGPLGARRVAARHDRSRRAVRRPPRPRHGADRPRRWPRSAALAGAAAHPRTSAAAQAVAAAGALGAEVHRHLTGTGTRPPGRPRGRRVRRRARASTSAAAPGGRCAGPDSPLQAHAAWHVLSAAALWLRDEGQRRRASRSRPS